VLLLTCCGAEAAPEAGTPASSSTPAATPAPTATPAAAAAGTATSSPSTTTPSSTTTSIASSGTPARDVGIPEGAAPVVDGTLEPGEWAGAAVTALDDGTEIRWMHAGGSLYVGIGGEEVGAVNLVLAAGDEVRMLHSSAALGSAVYRREGEAWRLESGFDWCCRSRTDDTDALALFESEGWTANIGFIGAPGQVEFRVAWPGDEARAAISSISPDGDVAFWPVDLGGEAREALHGERQDVEWFGVEAWPRIAP
jgi:hypothetical protein